MGIVCDSDMGLIDYYRILGVPPQATDTEMKRVYRHLAQGCHPDVAKEAGKEELDLHRQR